MATRYQCQVSEARCDQIRCGGPKTNPSRWTPLMFRLDWQRARRLVPSIDLVHGSGIGVVLPEGVIEHLASALWYALDYAGHDDNRALDLLLCVTMAAKQNPQHWDFAQQG